MRARLVLSFVVILAAGQTGLAAELPQEAEPPAFYAAGLTDVKVTLRVADTVAGEVREYSSPMGTAFAPIQDTDAFDTCP